MRSLTVVLALSVLGFPGLALPGEAGSTKRPRLDLRASPRMAFPPVSVLVVAELVGGGEHEDYYCPGLEWDWGDGNRSAQESDCDPFENGTALERRFSARHAYHAAGSYSVTLTLRRASRTVAVARVPVLVHGGGSMEEE
jgi:phage baseplate assembly protein gpV